MKALLLLWNGKQKEEERNVVSLNRANVILIVYQHCALLLRTATMAWLGLNLEVP